MGLPVDACRQVIGEAAHRSQAHLSSFTRVTAALKTIGLLSERMRPHYAQIGLLKYEDTPLTELQGHRRRPCRAVRSPTSSLSPDERVLWTGDRARRGEQERSKARSTDVNGAVCGCEVFLRLFWLQLLLLLCTLSQACIV